METDPAQRLREILSACTAEKRAELMSMLREEYPTHVLETSWNITSEAILEALHRSAPLIKTMFRGVLAEGACKVEVIDKLTGWIDVTPATGNLAYDFAVAREGLTVTIQAKLQRQEGGKPLMYRIPGRRGKAAETPFFVVETQRTRAGNKRKAKKSKKAVPSSEEQITTTEIEEKTRPYHFGDFDILAVAMEPAKRTWSEFRFTVGRWLLPRANAPDQLEIFQPVSLEPNEDWTDSLAVAIEWLRSGRTKTISDTRTAEGTSTTPPLL